MSLMLGSLGITVAKLLAPQSGANNLVVKTLLLFQYYNNKFGKNICLN